MLRLQMADSAEKRDELKTVMTGLEHRGYEYNNEDYITRGKNDKTEKTE